MSATLAVVILTHNEEQHIRRCINSIQHENVDVIVVDSFSDDKTVEIASEYGARVFQNKWKNYSSQFQWGLDSTEINSEWIFRLDADEYLEESITDLLALLQAFSSETSGVFVKRKYYFMGKWIRHGDMFPIEHLRVWRAGHGQIESRWMDEHIVVNDGQQVSSEFNIVDDNLNKVSWWIEKHNRYSDREMIDIMNLKYHFLEKDNDKGSLQGSQTTTKRFIKENIYSKLPFLFRPFLYFIYRYVIRLGFLDGRKGAAFHFLQAFWYRFLVDVKCLEASVWLGKERNPEKIREILTEKTGLEL